MNKLRERITRMVAPLPRTFALLLVASATCRTWADPYVTTGYEDFGETAGVVLWRATTSQGTFHDSNVIDVAADGTKGTVYAMDANKGATSWQRFASTQTGYESPGKILVYDETGYRASSDAQFGPLSFGGLYVKVLQADGTPYTITDNKTDSSERKVELGAEGESTLFKFEKSFTFNRNKTTEVKGTATVDVGSGAIFTINERNAEGRGAKVDSGNTLILKGSGTLKVVRGLTVGGTLDLSNSPSSINGDVTLSAGSTLVLPAGTAKNATVSIAVCSGTLTAGGMVNVKIGTDDAVSAELVVSGGTITKILTARTYTATVSGEKNLSALTWELDNVECDPVFGVSASAEVTVSAASTITIDSATTMATLKLLGSADLTITTSSQLTLAALNLSEYTGNVTISGTAFTLANGGLTGAATLILDPGAGNTYTMSQSNTGYTGEAVIKSGTVKMSEATSFGSLGRSSAIRVKGGAALSSGCNNNGREGETNRLILEEDAIYTSYNSINDTKLFPVSRVELSGNANIIADVANIGVTKHFNDPVTITMNGYTLTKTGNNTMYIGAVTFAGEGTLSIADGALSICSGYDTGANQETTFANGTINVASGVNVHLNYYHGRDATLSVKNLILDGSVTRQAHEGSVTTALTVTGYISGTGTTPMLTLANGATLKPKSITGGLTVTDSLTLGGSINVDLSEINLSSKADGTYFAILTAPADAAFNLANVTLNRGGNGSGWVLYSRETDTDSGIYELGVYLTPNVTWRGASGTWSDTSFNGGTDNYTTGRQVVFADNGDSTDALAVTVDGAKNVSALDFTADNRNVTLSGDAITAGTVSKSGDRVATVNNALSVTTSIAVSDGVLVVNPTAEVVSDEWTAPDNGTLVVYVGSGVTTTISAAITATKLIKRGAGTLVLSAANTISDRITVSGGTLKASTNVGCFGGESIPVYVEDGGAVDINNVRILNRVYIIGNGPDGNGAYINTGDSTKQNGAHAGGMQGNISNKLTLTGNASIGGDSTIHFGSNSSIDVGTYTLTKKGTFWLPLAGTTIQGTGKIVIGAGDFSNNSGDNDLTGIDLEITGGTLDMAAGNFMSVKGFKSATAINGNTAKLIVNGKIVANGTLTIPKLQLNNGASIELATTASKVAVSSAFTFDSGAVTCQFADGVTPGNATFLDLSALNLESAPAGSFVLSSTLAEEYLPSKTATGFSIAKGYASITDSGVTTPYADALTLAAYLTETYDYITVLGTGNVSLYWLVGFETIKIKNPNGATLSFIGLKDDYIASPSTVGEITTYTKVATPTIYTWTGSAKDYDQLDEEDNPLPDPRFTTLGNWSFVNSSSQTDTASRVPGAGDTIVFNAGAEVEIEPSASATFAAINIGGAGVAWTRYGESGTVTISATGGIVLTASDSSLTVGPNITLGTVTTTVEGKIVKWVTSDGSTTYTVADPVASIGVVQYGSLANAIERASNNDTITLAANCAESVNLGGKTITFSESSSTFTGSFSGSGTLILTALLKSASTDRWQSTWTGTVWLKNISLTGADLGLEKYGNSTSYLKLSNVAGYLAEYTASFPMISVELDNDNVVDGFGLKLNNGFGRTSDARLVTIKKLTGSGTLYGSDSAVAVTILVKDWADFTGTLTLKNKVVAFGSSVPSNALFGNSDSYNGGYGGFVYVCQGATLTIPAGANWETAYGYVVDGTLINNSTSLTGSGTALTFDGSGSVTQNATGTSSEGVTIKGYVAATINGTSAKFGTGNITLAGSSTLTYDPGVGNTYTMSNAQVASATKNNTIKVHGTVICDATSDGIKTAAFHVLNGGHLQIGTSTTSQNDLLGYYGKDDVGAVTVDKGGVLTFKSRETYTRNTTLNGGTIYLSSTQGSRGIDLYGGQTITVTDDSLIEATGGGSYIYLRSSNVAFDVAAEKVLTINASFKYDSGNSANDFNKTGDGTVVVNGYSGDSSFSQPKGVNVQGGTYELNTVQTKPGTGTDSYTIASGAKFTVGATGQANTTTLNLVDGSLLEFGSGNATKIVASTVALESGNATLSFSAGVTPTSGTKLIGWTTGPSGSISFVGGVNCELINGSYYYLKAEDDGLYVYTAGTVSGSAASITAVGATVALPDEVTSLTISVTDAAFGTITSANVPVESVVVKYGEHVTTGAYSISKDPSSKQFTFNINNAANASVTISGNEIKVQPEPVDTAPIGVSSTTTKPTFGVKAIPGLWYALKSSSSPAGPFTTLEATKQATESTVTLDAADAVTSVKYYKISAGATATDL